MEKNITKWIFLACLIVIEYCVFHAYFLREVIPYYPVAYDQTSYLNACYQLYENFKTYHLKQVVSQYIPLSQTFLFPIQALLFFLVFGASRLSALMLNFIYLVALQLFGFQAIKMLTGRYAFSFIFVGLTFAIGSFFTTGGIIDFRIDFMALCLYGILCAAILNSTIFLDRKWTIISAFIAVLLISLRFITVCYVLGVYFPLFAYYFLQWFLQKKRSENYSDAAKRIKHLIIFLGIILLFVIPILWIHYDSLYYYYVTGHVTGGEKLMRYQEAGIKSLYDNLAYYPRLVYRKHFTVHLTILSILSFVTLLFLHAKVKYSSTIKNTSKTFNSNIILFLALAIFIPMTILTLDLSKSVIVIGIVLAPLMYLIIYGLYGLCKKISFYNEKMANIATICLTIIFLLYGVTALLKHSTAVQGQHSYENDATNVVTKIVNDIGDYANFYKWKSIMAARDELTDFLLTPITSFYYETHGVLLEVLSPRLGANGLEVMTKEQAIHDMKNLDIYISSLDDYVPNKYFPFERSIHEFRSLLRQIADKTMIRLGDYYIHHAMYRVYVRPDMRITGLEKISTNKHSAEYWITAQGIWIDIPALIARKINTAVILEGTSDFSWLKQNHLNVSAITQLDGVDIPLHATITINKNHYKIICKLPKWTSNQILSIRLSFSNYFEKETKHHRTLKLVMKGPEKKYFEKKN